MLLSQFHRQVPLVEKHAAVNGFLGVAELDVGVDGLLAEPHRLELLAELVKDGRLFGQ